jgi:hypothetical protein
MADIAQLAPDPILDAPVMKAPPLARAPLTAWPCVGCGEQVPLAENACTRCGRPFLPADELPALAVPGVGDITRMDRTQRMVIALVAAVLATAVLVGLGYIAGSIL